MSQRDFSSFSPEDLSPFTLASGALCFAREEHAETHSKLRRVLKKFDELRGHRDPVADQNANLDVLLRSFEDECARNRSGRGFSDETAGLQLHIQLSRLWVYGAYEFVRTIYQSLLVESDNGRGKVQKHEDYCSDSNCTFCKIGHLKNDFTVVRIPMAKHKKARVVMRPPLPQAMKDELARYPVPNAPPFNKYLLPEEGLEEETGAIGWVKYDHRIGQNREFTRRALSDSILTFFD